MMLIKKLNSSNWTENVMLEVGILPNTIKTPLILQHFLKDLLIKDKAKALSCFIIGAFLSKKIILIVYSLSIDGKTYLKLR